MKKGIKISNEELINAIYNEAAKRIADAFVDAYASAYDKDMDCYTTSEKGYLIDSVLSNIATIGEDVAIDYDYIWDTAIDMYQTFMDAYELTRMKPMEYRVKTEEEARALFKDFSSKNRVKYVIYIGEEIYYSCGM